MRFIKAVIILILFMMGLLFLTQNQEALSTPLALKYDLYIDGLSWPTQAMLAQGNPPSVPFDFVILLSMAAGIFLSTLFFFLDKMRHCADKVRSRRSIKVLTNEIKRLHAAMERKNALLAASAEKPMLEKGEDSSKEAEKPAS